MMQALKTTNAKKSITLLLTLTVIVILFYGKEDCEQGKEFLQFIIRDSSNCVLDKDCSIMPAVSTDCRMPGACGLSLNSNELPYYYNTIILRVKLSNCEKECTANCFNINELKPVCINNRCDFITP